jgi:hypothetical protein
MRTILFYHSISFRVYAHPIGQKRIISPLLFFSSLKNAEQKIKDTRITTTKGVYNDKYPKFYPTILGQKEQPFSSLIIKEPTGQVMTTHPIITTQAIKHIIMAKKGTFFITLISGAYRSGHDNPTHNNDPGN